MSERYTRQLPPLVTRCLIAGALLAPLLTEPAAAQTTFTVDQKTSLAWWQVNPHLKHLWGTTCPGDPTWRAGEGVSIAQARSLLSKAYKRTGYAAVRDTIVPLYPRRRVRAVCKEAVSGQIVIGDPSTWRGVRGVINVRPEHLTSGLRLRDVFTNDLLDINKYPEVRFRIDSLTSVQRADTTRATVVGVLSLHGVDRPMAVPIKAWTEPAGLRVKGYFDISAHELVETYNLSKWKLGLGVGTAIWETLHLGFDVVMREGTAKASQ